MKLPPTVTLAGCLSLAAVHLVATVGCSPSTPADPGSGGSAAGAGGRSGGAGGAGGGPAVASGGAGAAPTRTGGVAGPTSSGGAGAIGSGGTGPATGGAAGGNMPLSTGGTGTGGAGAGTGGTSGGAGGGNPSGVPMFVAAGYRGRTTISCDDGASWVANHSDDDSVCPNHDCGEVFNTVTGLTYGDGYFFISRGWGMPGNVLRSRDGVNWMQLFSGHQFGGVAYGSGTLVIGSGWQEAWYSPNAGQTVTRAEDFSSALGADTGTIRSVSYHPHGGGRFILIPDDGAGMRKLMVSRDLGRTYTTATTSQDLCASRVTDVVSNANVILTISEETGYGCRSIDGGATWTGKQIATGGLSRQAVWTGSEFLVYGGGSGYRSPDGDSWTRFSLTPAGLRFGALTRSAVTGTLVATTPYGLDYGAQAFYRSADGVTWSTVAAGKFVGSHLIEHMAFGYGQRGPACP